MNKTLIAIAMLASASAAQAANFTGNDEVLSVIDFTNKTSYSVDLGVTSAAFTATPTLTTTFQDANWTAFNNGISSGDSLGYRLEGGYNTGRNNSIVVDQTYTTSLASDVTSAIPVLAIGTAVAAIVQELNAYATISSTGGIEGNVASAFITGSSYAGSYGNNSANILSNLITTAAVGSSLNLWETSKSGTTTIATNLGTTNFSINAGVGSFTLNGGTVAISAVPLPTSVWFFLTGVVGLLSVKRRKAA